MEITKIVKPFIRRGWPNTFGNIVYLSNNKKAKTKTSNNFTIIQSINKSNSSIFAKVK